MCCTPATQKPTAAIAARTTLEVALKFSRIIVASLAGVALVMGLVAPAAMAADYLTAPGGLVKATSAKKVDGGSAYRVCYKNNSRNRAVVVLRNPGTKVFVSHTVQPGGTGCRKVRLQVGRAPELSLGYTIIGIGGVERIVWKKEVPRAAKKEVISRSNTPGDNYLVKVRNNKKFTKCYSLSVWRSWGRSVEATACARPGQTVVLMTDKLGSTKFTDLSQGGRLIERLRR